VRGNWFRDPENCKAILGSFQHYLVEREVECLAYVLMPDHLHALLVQRGEGDVIPKLIQDFKKYASRQLRPRRYPDAPLWRIRYDDVPVPGTNAAATKVKYIHANPVRKGLSENEQDFAWSSARDYFETGSGPIAEKYFRNAGRIWGFAAASSFQTEGRESLAPPEKANDISHASR